MEDSAVSVLGRESAAHCQLCVSLLHQLEIGDLPTEPSPQSVVDEFPWLVSIRCAKQVQISERGTTPALCE